MHNSKDHPTVLRTISDYDLHLWLHSFAQFGLRATYEFKKTNLLASLTQNEKLTLESTSVALWTEHQVQEWLGHIQGNKQSSMAYLHGKAFASKGIDGKALLKMINDANPRAQLQTLGIKNYEQIDKLVVSMFALSQSHGMFLM